MDDKRDGRFSWVVCLSCLVNFVIIGGFIHTAGMLYLMFRNAMEAEDGVISLITSLHLATAFSVAPVAGFVSERIGVRPVAMAGAVLSTVGLACSSFSTQVYQLCLLYGVVAGCGMGLVMTLSITILDDYFDKYKRTACSLAMCGMGMGGFVLPPIVKALDDAYGWRGVILILAGISAQHAVMCSFFRPVSKDVKLAQSLNVKNNLILEPEKDQEDVKQSKSDVKMLENPKCVFGQVDGCITVDNSMNSARIEKYQCEPLLTNDLGALASSQSAECKTSSGYTLTTEATAKPLYRNTTFLCVSAYALICNFATPIVITHFGSYVLTLGLTAQDVVWLYMAKGLTSTVIRPIIGYIAQVTRANIAMIMMTAMVANGVLTIFLPLSNNVWYLYTYISIYEALLAPYNIFNGTIIMESVPKPQIGTAYGLTVFFCVPGAMLGAPIAGWLYGATRVYGYSFYVAGSLMVLAGITMVPAVIYARVVMSTRKQNI